MYKDIDELSHSIITYKHYKDQYATNFFYIFVPQFIKNEKLNKLSKKIDFHISSLYMDYAIEYSSDFKEVINLLTKTLNELSIKNELPLDKILNSFNETYNSFLIINSNIPNSYNFLYEAIDSINSETIFFEFLELLKTFFEIHKFKFFHFFEKIKLFIIKIIQDSKMIINHGKLYSKENQTKLSQKLNEELKKLKNFINNSNIVIDFNLTEIDNLQDWEKGIMINSFRNFHQEINTCLFEPINCLKSLNYLSAIKTINDKNPYYIQYELQKKPIEEQIHSKINQLENIAKNIIENNYLSQYVDFRKSLYDFSTNELFYLTGSYELIANKNYLSKFIFTKTIPQTNLRKLIVKPSIGGNDKLLSLFTKYKSLVFFDTETTGINIKSDRIIQISFKKIELVDFKLIETKCLEFFINYGKRFHLQNSITELTGIFDEDLQEKGISSKEAAKLIYDFINENSKALFVAYNTQFDINFLNVFLEENKFLNCLDELDFLDVFYAAIQSVTHECISNFKLSSLTNYYFEYGKKYNFHNAIDDVNALIDVSINIEKHENVNLINFVNQFPNFFSKESNDFLPKKVNYNNVNVTTYTQWKHDLDTITEKINPKFCQSQFKELIQREIKRGDIIQLIDSHIFAIVISVKEGSLQIFELKIRNDYSSIFRSISKNTNYHQYYFLSSLERLFFDEKFSYMQF